MGSLELCLPAWTVLNLITPKLAGVLVRLPIGPILTHPASSQGQCLTVPPLLTVPSLMCNPVFYSSTFPWWLFSLHYISLGMVQLTSCLGHPCPGLCLSPFRTLKTGHREILYVAEVLHAALFLEKITVDCTLALTTLIPSQ